MPHLTPEQAAAITPEMIAHAILAHAKRAGRAGLSVDQWLDREMAGDLRGYLATEGIAVEDEP